MTDPDVEKPHHRYSLFLVPIDTPGWEVVRDVEVMGLHAKVDELREQQWTVLLALQNEQLGVLREIRALLATTEGP